MAAGRASTAPPPTLARCRELLNSSDGVIDSETSPPDTTAPAETASLLGPRPDRLHAAPLRQQPSTFDREYSKAILARPATPAMPPVQSGTPSGGASTTNDSGTA
ncbi:MAG: hypothetical protein R3C05_25965 [Pirellulaceae bacterium]